MNARRLETWVWVAVYLGMLLFGLGLAVQRNDAALGWGIAVTGSVLTAIGIVLIWLRSRMKEDTP